MYTDQVPNIMYIYNMSTNRTPDASCLKADTTNEKYTEREWARQQNMDLAATLSPLDQFDFLGHSGNQ